MTSMPISLKNTGKSLLGMLRPSRRNIPMDADAQSSQRTAFEKVVDAEYALLLRSARRMCYGNADRAADIVQDSIVRAYVAWCEGRFTQGTNARAWLIRIVTNTFLNDKRQRGRWTEEDIATAEMRSGGSSQALHADEKDRPEASLLMGIMDESIEMALNRLPDDLRLTVLIVDVEGLDYAEAAVALSIPIGTVRSRLSRARIKLYNDLAEFAKARGIVGGKG